eukprot:TRINITY_DN194_c0_g1_i1.p1 TRINITY_DN194_c0_g1~~TRINITY_DN194_c0_g1_i1.p1  ORF type:complete len:395 (+),score=106.51 TRINITY_DN194_c0_g1_i1:85-1269(+)
MPPKAEKKEERVLLGRVSGQLKIGIVGLPNVGKSTFFNTLSKLDVPAENYPFCTIDPNISRIPVPDDRFTWLCEHHKPGSQVPGFLHVTDIAGLVRGASEGQGLGNAFLSHIRAVDAIFHVVRAFDHEDVVHVEGDVNPVRDLDIICEELRLKDLELLHKLVDSLEKLVQRVDKTKKAEYEAMKKVYEWVKAGNQVRFGEWKAAEVEFINPHQLLTAKPVIYLTNLSEDDYQRKKNKWLPKIKAWIDEKSGGETLIPFSGALESHLMSLPDDAARKAYCESKNLQSALAKIITTGYHALRLAHFFTAGEDEVKCWTITAGTKAPQAAGTIHTDFEKGFICAEVMKFTDFKEHGSESAVKAAGKCQQQGKGYTVEDGDIIFFKFNAGSGLQAKKK